MMKKHLKIFTTGVAITLLLSGCSSSTSKYEAEMAEQTVTVSEVLDQISKNTTQASLFSLVNKDVLSKEYSIENNPIVAERVEQTILETEQSNPTAARDSGFNSTLELLEASGQVLVIQQNIYVRDIFDKEYATEDALKKLYDERTGELVSFWQIRLSPTDFDNDMTAFQEAVDNIKALLSVLNEDVESSFEDLMNKYPSVSNQSTKNLAVDRKNVNEAILTQLDTLGYQGFTKEPISVDSDYVFVLNVNNSERESFETRKLVLGDLLFDASKSENSFLEQYILVQLRKGHEVKFASELDQNIYDANTQAIIDGYNDAVKSLKDGE